MTDSKPKAVNAFTAPATATQNRRFVITTADSLDTLHPDGPWIAAEKVVDVEAAR